MFVVKAAVHLLCRRYHPRLDPVISNRPISALCRLIRALYENFTVVWRFTNICFGTFIFCRYKQQKFSTSLSLLDCLAAHNSELYINVLASESQNAATQLATYVQVVSQWVGSRRLKLNADNTQLIWIGNGQQLTKLTVTQLKLTDSVVEFPETVVDLGVVSGGYLSMSRQVAAVCRSCFYEIRQLKSVIGSLTMRDSPFSYTDFCPL